MRTEDIFALSLGLTPPWKLLSQRLDADKAPRDLFLAIRAKRGATSLLMADYPFLWPEAVSIAQ